MKKITYTLIILLSTLFINVQAKNIDSLQKQLDTASTDNLKAKLYGNIAEELIQFSGPKTREINFDDAGKAITYVLKAIHYNAKTDDTLAMRNNFDCLGQAYFIQRKFTQAKWFVLQSKFISAQRKDNVGVINSLMQLASIKIAIKDYKMAEKDFTDAIALTKIQNDVDHQIAIEKCLATLYENTGRTKLAVATEKHCDYLAANMDKIIIQQAKVNEVRKIEETKLAAQQAKANQIKMAAFAKLNKVNNAKLAVQQAKTEKIKVKKYLAVLKAENTWPLLLTVNKPAIAEQSGHGEDTKGDAESSALAINMPQDK